MFNNYYLQLNSTFGNKDKVKKKKKKKTTTKNFIHTEHKNPGHSHILLSLRVKHALKLWIKFDPQVN